MSRQTLKIVAGSDSEAQHVALNMLRGIGSVVSIQKCDKLNTYDLFNYSVYEIKVIYFV